MEQLPGPARGPGLWQAPRERLSCLWGWMRWDPARRHGGSPQPAAAAGLCSQRGAAAAPPQAPPPQPTRDPPSAACAQTPHMVCRAGGQELLSQSTEAPWVVEAPSVGARGNRAPTSRGQARGGCEPHSSAGEMLGSPSGRGRLAVAPQLCPGPAPSPSTPGLSWHNLFSSSATPAGSVPHSCLPLPLPCPPLPSRVAVPAQTGLAWWPLTWGCSLLTFP